VDLPSVGLNMIDKPVNAVMLPSPQPINQTMLQIVGNETGLATAQVSGSNASTDLMVVSIGFVHPSQRVPSLRPAVELAMKFTPEKVKKFLNNSGQIVFFLAEPKSRGTVTLSSRNPDSNPNVLLNYWKDPADLDQQVENVKKLAVAMYDDSLAPWRFQFGTKEAEDHAVDLGLSALALYIHGHEAFRKPGDVEADPHFKDLKPVLTIPLLPWIDNPKDVKNWIEATYQCAYHHAGSCALGTVVDKDFKVMGVDNLRVVDASVFPTAPRTHPQSSMMMIGRYVGQYVMP